jgi:soluble lytic murein transglycosylase-like protein
VAALAGLAPVMGRSPGLFVAALAATALLAAGLILGFEWARRLASKPWRHVVNAAILIATLALGARVPPWTAVRELRDLMARERATEVFVVAHQVYAAYRRMDLEAQKEILRRAEVYEPSILEAGRAFGVSHELLMGIAATESSFHPRPSRDGGQGLFQITSVPRPAEDRARAALGVARLDPVNQKHNAYVAAATLAEYAERMEGDPLLTLLAYNIGPRNGGLEMVMKRYGARNFAQAQPYLQALPRDYPIRVLAAALAYRIWQSIGDLPRFEEGEWAARIRELGIPGLDGEASIFAARPR